ncbi:MAG TPA: 30S ribosomal protein S16 [Alphaproteobacteria bacterium]|nr:30S ribosomal protein S16 [Alphaproteobacteria bacterium]
MALKIRLSRGGSKNRPFFSIVVADGRSPRDGRFIEKIGSYDPLLPQENAKRVTLDLERAKHWLSKGAQPSERVQHFLYKLGVGEKPEIRETPRKSAPRAKTQERMKAAAEAAAKAQEAAAAPAPAAEAPAPEAPAAEAAQG